MQMGDMPAGSMSMGDGIPSLFTLQKMYWAVVGSAIGVATLVNMLNRALARHRYASQNTSKNRTNLEQPPRLIAHSRETKIALFRHLRHNNGDSPRD